jgi:hypothetical protein
MGNILNSSMDKFEVMEENDHVEIQIDSLKLEEKKNIITLKHDTNFTIFNSPIVNDWETKIILDKLSKIVFRLQGESTSELYDAYDDYYFCIDWNVLNHQPYIHKINCKTTFILSKNSKHPSVMNFTISFSKKKINIHVFESLGTKNESKKIEIKECKKKINIMNKCLNLLSERIEKKISEINIKFIRFNYWKDYYTIPQKIKEVFKKIYDVIVNRKEKLNIITNWSVSVDKYNVSVLSLYKIVSKYNNIEFEIEFNYGLCIKISLENKEYSFGIEGLSRSETTKYGLELCYNHVSTINKMNQYSDIMSIEEIDKIYNLFSNWIDQYI